MILKYAERNRKMDEIITNKKIELTDELSRLKDLAKQVEHKIQQTEGGILVLQLLEEEIGNAKENKKSKLNQSSKKRERKSATNSKEPEPACT